MSARSELSDTLVEFIHDYGVREMMDVVGVALDRYDTHIADTNPTPFVDPNLEITKKVVTELLDDIEHKQTYLTCSFCKETVKDIEAAIDAGWIPSYFVNGSEPDREYGPACEKCTRDHLELDPETREWVLQEGHPCPE